MASGPRRLGADGGRADPARPSATSSASRARRSTRWPSARSTRASSSRGTSASSATASTSSTSRSPSATSTAASSERSLGGPAPADHRTTIETARRRHDDRPRDGLLPGRRGARRRAPSRRARRRCAASRSSSSASRTTSGDLGALAGDVGFLPDRLLLRPAPRRLPQHDRAPLRQPLRPRPRPARRRRASTSTTRSRAELVRAARRGRCGTLRGAVELLLETAVGPGAVRGHRRASTRRRPRAARPRRPRGARLRASPATCAATTRPGIYRFAHIPVIDRRTTATSSPAPSCAGSRSQRSLRLHPGAARAPSRRARSAPPRSRSRPEHVAVSLVEGWRGEICHVAITDARRALRALQGRRPLVPQLDRAWRMALRDQEISDFPLCNKSFNLSYCGHDL